MRQIVRRAFRVGLVVDLAVIAMIGLVIIYHVLKK